MLSLSFIKCPSLIPLNYFRRRAEEEGVFEVKKIQDVSIKKVNLNSLGIQIPDSILITEPFKYRTFLCTVLNAIHRLDHFTTGLLLTI